MVIFVCGLQYQRLSMRRKTVNIHANVGISPGDLEDTTDTTDKPTMRPVVKLYSWMRINAWMILDVSSPERGWEQS